MSIVLQPGSKVRALLRTLRSQWAAHRPPAGSPQNEPGQRAPGQAAWRPRGIVGEVLAVIAGGFAVAVAMTWPALRHPTTTLPHDLIDPSLIAWDARWGAHAVLNSPGQLFDGNSFYPATDSYAFSDTLLGYWPLGILGGSPGGAMLAVNLIYVLACALASIGGYALARQLGANRIGSIVAGLAVAYAPWRLGHIGHPHVISTGGIMLCLAMLARGHGFSIRHGLRPERAHVGWIVGGWLAAAWQITIGFGIGLVFAYVLAGMCVTAVVLWWRRGRPPVRRGLARRKGASQRGTSEERTGPNLTRLALADLGGGLLFAVVGALMAMPYLRVVDAHPYARRGIAEINYYSPPWQSFLAGPDEALLWRTDHLGLRSTVPVPDEMTLLPGFTLYALAAVGLVVSVWSPRWRRWLGVAVAASILLAMGTNVPPGGWLSYRLLYQLPGWDALRTPGRLVVWTTLLLALLAAGAVTASAERLPAWLAARRTAAWTAARPERTATARAAVAGWLGRRPRLVGQAAGVLAATLVLVEGLGAVGHPVVPAPPAALTAAHAAEVEPPLLVLPSNDRFDPLVLLWSTDGFPALVNGLSGFTPASQAEIRSGTHSFPDPNSVALLRRYGVHTVVVLRDWVPGTPWERAADAPVDGLDITRREIDDAVVYSLS